MDIEVGPEPASADAGPETKAQQTNLASQAPHEGGRGPGWLGGALQGWLLRTLCNMQVTLKHVSLAWVGADGAVAARCAFQSLEFYTDPSLVADMEVRVDGVASGAGKQAFMEWGRRGWQDGRVSSLAQCGHCVTPLHSSA